MKSVVSVLGKDHPGIIARVSTVLFENNANILDISQTIMQDMFTMVMLIETENSIADITQKLDSLGEELGVSIHIQREELFSAMHRI